MLVLFDVDGTLLLTRRLGVECVRDALELQFGVPIDVDRASFPGGLDPLIYRDLCTAHSLPDPELHHDAFRAHYHRLLTERLAAEPGRAYALPGVLALLDALEAREELALGILSGNYPDTGRLKLAAAGIDPERFAIQAWGTDGHARHELCAAAIARFESAHSRALPVEHVTLVGDTPRDVECARAVGCRVLAVATGRYSTHELAAAGAELAVETLEATEALARWIAHDEGAREPDVERA